VHELLIYFDPKVLAMEFFLASVILFVFKRKRTSAMFLAIAVFWILVLLAWRVGFAKA
jgi:hypothetical protein